MFQIYIWNSWRIPCIWRLILFSLLLTSWCWLEILAI